MSSVSTQLEQRTGRKRWLPVHLCTNWTRSRRLLLVLLVLLPWILAAADQQQKQQRQSLSYYDDLRVQGASELEVLANDVFTFKVSDDQGGQEQTYRLRHLSALIVMSLDTNGFNNAAGALLAVHHFNNRISTVVPEIDQIEPDCSLRFTIELMDTSFSPIKAAEHLIKDVFPREKLKPPDPTLPYPSALIGASRSAVSSPLAILTGVHGLMQISHASTSTSLDNKGQYPTFGRMIPSAIGDAYAAVDYFSNELSVTHLAVLFVKDPYGSTYSQAIKEAAGLLPEARRMDVTLFPFEFDASEDDIATQLRHLKNSQNRYIVGIFFENHLETVMSEASRQGVAGPGYFWMYGDALNGVESLQYNSTDHTGVIAGITGSALLLTAHPRTRLGRQQTAAFMQEWEALLISDEWRDYLNAKMPKDSGWTGDKNELSIIPNSFTLLMYDAVISIALASCNIESSLDDFKFSSVELYEAFKTTEFEGAYSTVVIDHDTGSRDYTTVPYSVTNLVATEPDMDGMVSFSANVTHSFERADETDSPLENDSGRTVYASEWQAIEGTKFVYSDGTTTPPPVLPPYEQEKITLSPGARIFGLVLCGAALLLSIFFYAWTSSYRKTVVVRASQPLFLDLLCVGTFIMAAAVIPMSIEESDAACQAIPWLFTTGFICIFSALFSKMSRVNKMYFRRDCRRVVVGARDVMKPFLFLFTANLAVLISWTIVAPLTSKYVETGAEDMFGRSTSAYHSCSPQDASRQDLAFLLLILSINLISLLYANVEAFRGRSIRTQYSESRFIGLTMLILLQAFIIGIPLFFVAYDSPTARFVVSASLTFILCTAVLLPMFLPKMRYLREHQEQQERIAVKKKLEKKKQWVLDGLAYGDWQSEGVRASAHHRVTTACDEENAAPGLEIMDMDVEHHGD